MEVVKMLTFSFVKNHSYCTHKYSEVDINKMLEHLIDTIYVVFGNQVFQQSVGILMGTKCAPLLADLFFLYSYEAEFTQKLVREKNKSPAVAFNSTFRYIDDVLSINNCYFHTCVASIHPSELEIKDTAEFASSVSYLDTLLDIDIDGGTVEITALEVKKKGDIKELVRSNDWKLGSGNVDMAFKSLLTEIATKEMIEGYSKKYPEDYLDLFMKFEIKKCGFTKGQDPNSYLIIQIPVTLIYECRDTLKTDLNTLINNSKFKGLVILKSDKLRINVKLFETFFQSACDGIIKHVKELFQSPKVKDVSKILMVGGFSESLVLQEAIRNAFPNCQVIVPHKAGLAVLRGAVLMSSIPGTTSHRVSRHTYGVDMDARFDPIIHKESKKEVIDGVEYCTGLFDKLIKKGEKFLPDKASGLKFYIPMTPKQNFVLFYIFSSEESDPLYTEQCTCLGKIVIHVPVGLKNRILSVQMGFNSTMLTVESMVLETGERAAAKFDLLEI